MKKPTKLSLSLLKKGKRPDQLQAENPSSPAAEEDTAPAAKGSQAKIGLGKVRLSIMAGSALILAATGLGLYLAWSAWCVAQQEATARYAVTTTGDNMSDHIAHLHARMRAEARNPALIRALRAGQSASYSPILAHAFPEAWKVRLLPAGLDAVDQDDTPPIGFALLQMLHQGEKTGKPPPIEAQMVSTPKANVVLAYPVAAGEDKKVIGHIVLQLKLAHMMKLLKPLSSLPVEVSLHQSIGVHEDLVVYDNRASKDGEELPDRTAIPASHWQIQYGVDTSKISLPTTQLVLLLGLLTGTWLAIVALAYLVTGRYGDALQSDLRALFNSIKDALGSGQLPRLPTPKVTDLESAFYTLGELGTPGQGAKGDMGGTGHGISLDMETEVGVELDVDTGGRRDESAAASNPLDSVFDTSGAAVPASPAATTASLPVPVEIFRAYDIRGIAGRALTPALMQRIGSAFGSEAYEKGQQSVVVARDGRTSSPALAEALTRGLLASGRDVIDIGMVPTPLLYFSTHFLGSESGLMVTGSHNPAEYNGLKMVLRGEALAGEAIQDLRRRVADGPLSSGEGTLQQMDVRSDYVERVSSDIGLFRSIKVVIDCANGVTAGIAATLLQELGCEVHELNCEVDGNFPKHAPDPSQPSNLAEIGKAVVSLGAELGIAFDGDGDRLGVVTETGEIIWPDRLLMLFAQDVLSRNPGAVILYDVKSTSNLARVIQDNAGRPFMWKSGHSFIKAKMKETGALLAGELSGHIFFQERWFGFDDALYSAARLLEILSREDRPCSEVFAEFPDAVNTPELRIPMHEGKQHEFMQKLLNDIDLPGAEVSTIDGVRAEFEHGWGLLRASNTTPALILRFEAQDRRALRRIQDLFREHMLKVDPSLNLPF